MIDPVIGTIGASLLGGLFGSSNQASANALAAESAQKQMDFQERMSNTAHQREVADLKAAGLNPILTATGGNGSSTPSGASYSPTAYDPSNTVNGINSAFKLGAIDKVLAENQVKQTAANIRKTESDISVNEESKAQLRANTLKALQDTKTSEETQRYTAAQTQFIGTETQKAMAMIEGIRLHPEQIMSTINLNGMLAGQAGANSAKSWQEIALLKEQLRQLELNRNEKETRSNVWGLGNKAFNWKPSGDNVPFNYHGGSGVSFDGTEN